MIWRGRELGPGAKQGPTPFPQAATTAKCCQDPQERNWPWHGGRLPIARKSTYLCATEAARAIGKFIVKMIVIHVGQNPVPIDIAEVSMALVQILIGQQYAPISAGAEYAKAVKCESE